MKCYNCDGELEHVITDLPFKTRPDAIVIIKQLPVMQCRNCYEYVIEDLVMEQVDYILDKINESAELEIVKYAV